MFDLIPNLIASVLTVLFPVFASYKALRTSDPAQLSPWLMYWVSFALFALFEDYTYWVLGWLPLYGTARLLFLLYLVLPQTQGARIAYQQHIHPFLAHHERQIEEAIGDAYARLQPFGIDHLGQLIELVKTYILRMQGQEPDQPANRRQSGRQNRQQQGSGGGGGFFDNILGSFNLPSAREGMAAPAGDFYGLLSSATSVLGRASGASPSAQVDELSKSGVLIPSHVRTPSEKARYLKSEREKLQVLLRALDNEADDDEGLSRNRSEVSFDRISDDEVRDHDAHRESGGGWFGYSGDKHDRQERHERHDRYERHERHERHEKHGRTSGHDLAY